MPSGYTFGEKRSTFHGADAQADVAKVISVPSHTDGDLNQHIVQIQTDPDDPNSTAWVPVNTMAIGDVVMPVEGDTVRVAYEKGNRPVVTGIRYNADDGQADPRLPEYGPGHRRIGHEPTDAHVEIFPDGTVEICSAQNKPLLLCGGTQQVFLFEDFQYQPNGTYFQVPFDRVETRLLSQDFMDEHSITTTEDTAQLPLWDDSTYEWVIPQQSESEWREADPRGSLWTVSADIRFEMIKPQTACEVGLFIREKNEPLSAMQLVESAIAHGSHQETIPAVTVDLSCTERFPDESRLSIHVRSTDGGLLSSNALTYNQSPYPIQSDVAGEVENWDRRFERVRQTNMSITQDG